MENKNTLREESISFAVAVSDICDNISGCSVYNNQLLRASSSIGANIHEAKYAQSRADFIHKSEIALKEAVLNQVYNFNYIDRILRNWEKKNIKTAQDVKREQEKFNNYQSKKNNKGQDAAIQKEVPIFNWLDGKKKKK